MARKSWNDHFIGIAQATADRATCPRASVGAVLVKSHRVVAYGYNGAPSGWPHCSEVGCRIITVDGEERCARTIHAEINAILTAARFGIPIEGCSIYITHSPCYSCYAAIANAGIVEVFYDKEYRLDDLKEIYVPVSKIGG